MIITVRVFAQLRERLGFEQRQLELPEAATATSAWAALTGEDTLPRHVLCAVNMEYAHGETVLADGDEVAFFPPVTGG
ncbi:MAG: molybdopterin converting factor subunit 1 [Halofilum sp. (in: g-proteobacteria)]|nr:molybdopterin converting factor subunit 1 [Halofilum sp. (in: g-proteobacteria)]